MKDSDKDQIDFDKLDFDSELDLEGMGGFDPAPRTGARAAVEETGKSFLKGVKSSVTDTAFIRKLVGLTLPKGYSQVFNAYDGTRSAIDQIYRENEGELRPHLASINRKMQGRKSFMKTLLPKGLRNALEAAEADGGGSNYSAQDDGGLGANLSSLDNLFKLEASSKAEERLESARKELKDDRKFKIGVATNSTIANGISRLVRYQDKVLVNFQRKSLEIGYRQFDVQRRLLLTSEAYFKDAIDRLDSIQKNTALPDFVKMKHSEVVKERLRNRLADAAVGGITDWSSKYFGQLTSNASSMLGGALSGLNLMSSMGGMGSKEEIAGGAIGSLAASYAAPVVQSAAEHLASMIAPSVEKLPGVKKGGDFLRGVLTDPQGRLNRFKHSETKEGGVAGFLKAGVKTLLPGYSQVTRIEGEGIEGLGDVAQFDNQFYTSVTQIMPAYLESMDRSLRSLVTGEDVEGQAWSHYTGGMVSRSTLDKQHLRIGVMQGQGLGVRREVSDLLSKMGADELSPSARSALARRMLIDLRKGYNFQPSDYVKMDSWPEIEDEAVAEELVEFFADRFELDHEGKFSGGDLSFTRDMEEAFVEASRRMPKTVERASVLAERVMGRDTLRRLGLSKYDGHQGDSLNMEAFAAMELGDHPISVTKYKGDDTVDVSKMSLQERMDYYRKRSEMDTAKLSETEREDQARRERDGEFDTIDTAQRPYGGVNRLQRRRPGSPVVVMRGQGKGVESETGGASKLVSDMETHRLLAQILKSLNGRDTSTPASDLDGVDQAAEASVTGLATAKGMFAKAMTTAKSGRDHMVARAKALYRENDKVKAVVDKLEQTYGKITNKQHWAGVVETIYSKTGTPEEIYQQLSKKFKDVKERAQGLMTEGGTYARGKADAITQWATEQFDKRDEHMATAKGMFGRAKTAAGDKVKVAGEWISNLKSPNFMEGGDSGTHERLDLTNEILASILEMQASGGGSGGDAKDGGGAKPGWMRRITGGVATGLKKFGLGTISLTWSYLKNSYKALYGGAKMALGAASDAAGAVFTDKSWGVRDVHVKGEKKPRLRAVKIRNGMYVDKNTGKVVEKLKDITGAVIETSTGSEVISQEEFDQDLLVDGNGDSLAMYLGRKATGIGIGVAKVAGMYTLGSLGLLSKVTIGVAKMATKLVRDQLTQFDAYFPGEKKPRINSFKMREGYYRDAEGGVIRSLKDIDGPVYDIHGNEVISQEEIDQYGSLYSRNGSLLFTFGRGMASLASLAGSAALAYGKFSWKVAKAGIGLARRAGGAILNKFTGRSKKTDGNGLSFGGVDDTVFWEQLRIQEDILRTLKERNGDGGIEHDSDGDGVRDNSWLDIMNRRKSRRARDPNAGVIDAIEGLGDRLDENFDALKGDKESGGMFSGIKDKLKGWGSAALGAALGGLKTGARSLLKGGGRLLAGGAKGLLTGAGKLLMGGGKLALAGAKLAVPAIITAGKVAGAALSAVGWPLVLAGIAIGAVAYVGWKMYQNAKFKDKPLHYLRMTQYGVSPTKGERVEPILQLEALMGGVIKGLGTAELDFDPNKVDMGKIYEIFQVEVPEEGGESERIRNLHHWLAYRFKPVFLKHVSALHALGNTGDLNVADSKITTKDDTLSFLDMVQIFDARRLYDELDISPFDGRLTENNNDVVKMFGKIKDLSKKRPEKSTASDAAGDGDVPVPDVVEDTPIKAGAKPREGSTFYSGPPDEFDRQQLANRFGDGVPVDDINYSTSATTEASRKVSSAQELAKLDSMVEVTSSLSGIMERQYTVQVQMRDLLKGVRDDLKALPIDRSNGLFKQPGMDQLSGREVSDAMKPASEPDGRFKETPRKSNIDSRRTQAIT